VSLGCAYDEIAEIKDGVAGIHIKDDSRKATTYHAVANRFGDRPKIGRIGLRVRNIPAVRVRSKTVGQDNGPLALGCGGREARLARGRHGGPCWRAHLKVLVIEHALGVGVQLKCHTRESFSQGAALYRPHLLIIYVKDKMCALRQDCQSV
jgi:hypothetical protein